MRENVMGILNDIFGREINRVIEDTCRSREDRHWITKEYLDDVPWLPERLTVDEVKDFGMVNLVHAAPAKSKHPWLPAGHYKMIANGRLYLIEIDSNATKGVGPTPWLYRPKIRVKARSP